jgi:hypothetical protein
MIAVKHHSITPTQTSGLTESPPLQPNGKNSGFSSRATR